ncbi:uncharacterized protein LOC119092369 [Pollicipes pollicipes]|uniref:uncharacterized protein LOC119092369 n=1 Tax=Pollicipes pollicipes TaxID=41117 RepID=UPI00188562FE|nr:uncharacterized protein LOC119092369 [Pollicipes pollicipes]
MDYFTSNTRGSRHVDQSQGGGTYDMDFYATSYSSAHNIPHYKPTPPLIRDGTGFIRSLVPTGEIGVMATPEVKRLTHQLCRSALPERHSAWVMHDGREPLPAAINDNSASGYASNATPTQQIVKLPRSWRSSPGRPACFMRDLPLAREHLVKNPPKDYVSEYQGIFRQKPFHTDLAGTCSPENPEIICETGFTHERGAEGGPQARHYVTPPTAYQSEFPPVHLRPPDRLPSNNNDTRDVGTGYPHHRAVLVGGILRPPRTRYQFDFDNPTNKETKDNLLPTKISSSGFNSNNPIKLLQLDSRSFCTDYKGQSVVPRMCREMTHKKREPGAHLDAQVLLHPVCSSAHVFVDLTPKGAAREGHTTGNITARTQIFYPLASFRHHMQAHNDSALPGRQAYVLRSWAARSAPGGIGTQQRDGPLVEPV